MTPAVALACLLPVCLFFGPADVEAGSQFPDRDRIETEALPPATASGAITPADETPAPVPEAETESGVSVRLLVLVETVLQQIVRKAAVDSVPSMQMIFAGEPDADRYDFRIELEFISAVDQSGQTSNRDGAAMMGPVGWLVGAITPWSCPTTHTLAAVVRNRRGDKLGSIDVERLQKRIGTMLKCSQIDHPSDSIVTEMVGEFAQRFRDEWFLPDPAATP